MLDPVALLEARVRRDAGAPLLTHRLLADGSRVELSGRTVAPGAATVQWALEDAGVEPGDAVSLPVLADRPAHWAPLAFLLGVWQRGAVPTLGHAEVVVGWPGAGADLTCPEHPLGLGTDVLTFPDAHHREPLAGVALDGPAGSVAWADVTVQPTAGRALVASGPVWDTVAAGLLGPLLGGGAAVLLDGLATPELAAAIADEERVG